jgi:hypothetical protein
MFVNQASTDMAQDQPDQQAIEQAGKLEALISVFKVDNARVASLRACGRLSRRARVGCRYARHRYAQRSRQG